MKLLIAFEVCRSPEDGAAYYWWCADANNRHQWDDDPIPAPEYDWLWWAEGIPQEDLDEWPELAEEVAGMWARLPEACKRAVLARVRGEEGE